MIINTQAFSSRKKSARRIYRKLDSFRSRRPVDVIASVNPIVIIDEPQSVIGEADKRNVARNTIGRFNPLFFINYSATHRENFNLVYQLDAVDAYQKQLVKKISVKGISVTGIAAMNGYLYLQKINVYPNKSPSATVVIEHNAKSKSGIKKKIKTLEHGDDVYDHSGEIEAYKNGYKIVDINARDGYVEFTGGLKIELGQVVGDSSEEDVRRIQIRETIQSHLDRERALFNKGVKVLSLFFIDEVAKYKFYDDEGEQQGLYAELFEAEYKHAVETFLEELPFEEDDKYRKYLERDEVSHIHNGYFSVDKKNRVVDSKVKRGESSSSDVDAYDLIMRRKERLLSFDEPTRFIFSHSALREGWDNPNVFQICTLRVSSAEIRKRQEIGRGLRLCVNQNGERMDSDILGAQNVHDTNVLTVVANESYEEFASTLQDEFYEVVKNRPRKVNPELFTGQEWTSKTGEEVTIESGQAAEMYAGLKGAGFIEDYQLTDEFHELKPEQQSEELESILKDIDPSLEKFSTEVMQLLESVYDPSKSQMVSNDRKKVTLHLDSERYASKAFKKLWNNIKRKSYYTVEFDESKLITACIDKINSKLTVTTTVVTVTEGYLESTGQDTLEMKKRIGDRINVEEIASKNVEFDLVGDIAKDTNLTRRAVAEILSGIEEAVFSYFSKNPQEFIRKCSELINEQKAATIVEHISYDLLDDEWSSHDIFVEPTINGQYGSDIIDVKNHLYDKLKYDSGVEKDLAGELDVAEQVEFYVKLPSGFYIHTPMGTYNPDWAVAFKEGSVKHIYFVAETKGDSTDMQLTGMAKAKEQCAKEHFKVISDGEVKYSIVDSYAELMKTVST